jgi:hypothetical protein
MDSTSAKTIRTFAFGLLISGAIMYIKDFSSLSDLFIVASFGQFVSSFVWWRAEEKLFGKKVLKK